ALGTLVTVRQVLLVGQAVIVAVPGGRAVGVAVVEAEVVLRRPGHGVGTGQVGGVGLGQGRIVQRRVVHGGVVQRRVVAGLVPRREVHAVVVVHILTPPARVRPVRPAAAAGPGRAPCRWSATGP